MKIFDNSLSEEIHDFFQQINFVLRKRNSQVF